MHANLFMHNPLNIPEPCPLIVAALAQARQSLNLTSPNPHVGCVIASSSGEVPAKASVSN